MKVAGVHLCMDPVLSRCARESETLALNLRLELAQLQRNLERLIVEYEMFETLARVAKDRSRGAARVVKYNVFSPPRRGT